MHAAASNARPPGRFHARPVLAVTAPPCGVGQLPGPANRCYALGPVALDARQVSSATSSFRRGAGYGIDMVFTADGLRRFNALAAQRYGQPPPSNEVAIVVDGRVVSAPAFQTTHFADNGVRVSGPFSEEEARHVANVIG